VAASREGGLAMHLSQPMDIALHDGLPDGRYQVGGGGWHGIRDGMLALSIDRLSPRLEEGQPVVRAHAVFDARFLRDFAR